MAAIGHGGLKEGQIVNRLAEEYGKDHRQAITDEIVLERVAEANRIKSTLPSQRVASSSRELMIWQSVSPDAVIRYREMRSSDLLQRKRTFHSPNGLYQYDPSVRSGTCKTDSCRMGRK